MELPGFGCVLSMRPLVSTRARACCSA